MQPVQQVAGFQTSELHSSVQAGRQKLYRYLTAAVLDNLQNCVYPNKCLPEQLRDCYQAVLNSLLLDGSIVERCNDAFIPFAARAGMVLERGVFGAIRRCASPCQSLRQVVSAARPGSSEPILTR